MTPARDPKQQEAEPKPPWRATQERNPSKQSQRAIQKRNPERIQKGIQARNPKRNPGEESGRGIQESREGRGIQERNPGEECREPVARAAPWPPRRRNSKKHCFLKEKGRERPLDSNAVHFFFCEETHAAAATATFCVNA